MLFGASYIFYLLKLVKAIVRKNENKKIGCWWKLVFRLMKKRKNSQSQMYSLTNLIKLKLFLVVLVFMNGSIHADPLKEYLWTNRIIISFSNTASNTERHLLIQQIEAEKCKYRLRDLKHIDLIKDSGDYERLRHKFSIADHPEFKLLLIGKDGKEKLSTNSGDLKAIFSVVDSMPMRKREMHSAKCLTKNHKEQ